MEKRTCIYVYIYIRVVSSAPEMTKMCIYFNDFIKIYTHFCHLWCGRNHSEETTLYFNDLKYSYTCNNICVYLFIFVSIHRCVGIYICI